MSVACMRVVCLSGQLKQTKKKKVWRLYLVILKLFNWHGIEIIKTTLLKEPISHTVIDPSNPLIYRIAGKLRLYLSRCLFFLKTKSNMLKGGFFKKTRDAGNSHHISPCAASLSRHFYLFFF